MNIIALDDEKLAMEGICNTIRKVSSDAEVNGFVLVEPAKGLFHGEYMS